MRLLQSTRFLCGIAEGAKAGDVAVSSVECRLETENDRVFWLDYMRHNQIHQLVAVILCNEDDVLAALSIKCVRIGQSTFAHAAQVAGNGRPGSANGGVTPHKGRIEWVACFWQAALRDPGVNSKWRGGQYHCMR